MKLTTGRLRREQSQDSLSFLTGSADAPPSPRRIAATVFNTLFRAPSLRLPRAGRISEESFLKPVQTLLVWGV